MLRKMNISWRLTILVLLAAGCILAAVVGYSYFSARKMLEEELTSKAKYMAMATANRIETVTQSVEKDVQVMAITFNTFAASEEEIYKILKSLLRENEEIYGAAVALPFSNQNSNQVDNVPYVCRNANRLITLNLAQESYDYRNKDWYKQPEQLGRAIWSEPYFDEGGGNILMATYSVPFLTEEGKVRGVVTSDISLDWLSDLLASLPLGNGGYAFIISQKGEFIAHPQKKMIMGDTIFEVAESRRNEGLRKLAKNMVQGESGFVPYNSLTTGKVGWLAHIPIPSTDWSLGVVFSREELLAKVFQLTHTLLFIGILGFALLLIVVLFIAHSITQPIRELDQASRSLAAGNMDVNIPYVAGDDEVAHLAGSFATMLGELKVYMEMLEVTAVEKERIASELRIAHSIQMGLVPKTFPPFPERDDLEIYAVLEPARQVGGDFYDFFLLDDEHICLVIGDVSGKGVPAAIFMAVTRTFLKALSREVGEPAAILDRINNEIVQDNESCMFVTLFCAVVHLPTGKCSYANGGHNPPFHIKMNGVISSLANIKGVPIGVMEDMNYTEGTINLEPGDALFLYTDGVTEAENDKGKFLGTQRVVEELIRLKEQDCRATLTELQKILHCFAEGAEQSDDITMLMFRLKNK